MHPHIQDDPESEYRDEANNNTNDGVSEARKRDEEPPAKN
jgi:hypothetical protein